MKKITFMIVAAGMLAATSVYAGYTADIRPRCNTFTKRYKSLARISIGVPTCLQESSNCSGNYTWSLHPSCSKDCGFQEAWSGPSGKGQNGYILKNICSRGEEISDLNALLLPQDSSNEYVTDTIEASSSNISSINFNTNTHSIEINGFSGRIRLTKGNGFLSKMRLAIWKPNDDTVNEVEDIEMNENEIISFIEISATDAGITINGDLSNVLTNNATIVNDSNYCEIIFTNLSFDIPINQSINLDDLAVRQDGDGAPNSTQNLRKTQDNTITAINESKIAFDCFPNPVKDNLKIAFQNKDKDGIVEVFLFDALGKKIKEVYNSPIKKDQEINLNTDLSLYPPQMFFVLIQCNGQKYIKEIIKN